MPPTNHQTSHWRSAHTLQAGGRLQRVKTHPMRSCYRRCQHSICLFVFSCQRRTAPRGSWFQVEDQDIVRFFSTSSLRQYETGFVLRGNWPIVPVLSARRPLRSPSNARSVDREDAIAQVGVGSNISETGWEEAPAFWTWHIFCRRERVESAESHQVNPRKMVQGTGHPPKTRETSEILALWQTRGVCSQSILAKWCCGCLSNMPQTCLDTNGLRNWALQDACTGTRRRSATEIAALLGCWPLVLTSCGRVPTCSTW